MDDPDVALACVDVIQRSIERKATAITLDRAESTRERIGTEDIGVAVTHKVLMQRIIGLLQARGIDGVKVDTAERWQGLERKLMVIVHPLSSTPEPDFDFDLGTGRLCVMASRHQHGMVVVSRDHLHDTLAHLMPSATQPLGRRDEASRSLRAHRMFLKCLDGERS
jgi:superfamily I DNA and/or RNA helicase